MHRIQANSREFVALMALTMSMVALSIDAMLPALGIIADDLMVEKSNDRQLIVSVLFIGMGIGQLLYGPISDSLGRKSPMFLSMLLFIIGSAMSAFASSFQIMLLGRFLQGLGAAGPRTISVAIIRDTSSGSEMARLMSLVMMVFILVPIIAPSLGQLMLYISGWRAIFWAFVVIAGITLLWFQLRQSESLPLERRKNLSFSNFLIGLKTTLFTRQSFIYMIASSLIFGAFVGYLNSSQQILQEYYALGDQFALYFAMLAISLGVSSYFNSRLVNHFGLRQLCVWALILTAALSALFFGYCHVTTPGITMFMAYLMVVFLFIGTLFSNFNALAMEPLGEVAGTASSVIGFFQTMISVSLGFFIGQLFDQSVLPLVSAFLTTSVLSLILILLFDRNKSVVL